MPDLKKLITLEALQAALPSWLKSLTKPSYNADEISDNSTVNKFVTETDKANWNAKGTYSKPPGGIPKSDLSSIVQTSLEKADSALQSETDPTVPSWAKQLNKPSYTQDEVADGSTYKRVSQTEKSAWNGKQNALTTTQMQAVNSGITSEKVGQISTNQTNIWYVSEHNANRNLLLNTASTTTIDGVTFTVNADKSVTITGSQNNPSKHTKLVLGKFTANRSDLVLDSGIAASASANIFINTQDGVTTTRNLGHATITGTDLNTERDYQILVIAGTSNINTTIKPMICTQADWNATQEYESSGGLPNSDLTYLEAEDRAALAEEIDSGAKNLADIPTSQTIGSVTFTKDSNEWITSSSSTPDGRQWSDANKNVSYSVKAGRYIIYGETPNTNSGTVDAYVIVNGSLYQPLILMANSNGTVEVNLTSAGTIGLMYKPYSTNKVRYMITTKAAFGVSQKFVPYRPDYDLVCAAIARSNNHGLKKMVSFSTSAANTYEIITNSKITVPANKMIRMSAAGMWRNSYCTGIKIQIGNDLRDIRTLAINETTTAYNGLPVTATYYNDNTDDIDLYIAARTDNTTSSMLVIIYDIV